MATDYIDVGPAPYDEACTPAGRDRRREIQECQALRNQIRRLFGPEPAGARLRVRTENQGEYVNLVCEYEEGNETAMRYAIRCQNECPQYWDLFARVELTAGLIPIVGDGAWINKY